MSSLSYAGISLEFLKTNEISRDVVMSDDGSGRLFNRHTFDVHAVVNPFTTSYDATKTATPGIVPALTDVNIREALSVPRQKLIYKVGNDTLLESPSGGALMDSNN